MRIDVKKYAFIGLESDRPAFFKKAQDAGIINFIDASKKSKESAPDVNNFIAAIKILRALPVEKQVELDEYALAEGLVYKILHLQETIEKLAEESRINRLEMARVHIFGEFSLNDITYIEKQSQRKVQYFFGKHDSKNESEIPEELLLVGTENNLDYFIAFSKEPKQYPKLIEMRFEHSLGTLKAREIEITKEIHDAEQRLKSYAKYNTFLHHALVSKLNSYNLNSAETSATAAFDNTLFIISGWVPVNKLKELHELVADMHVHAEEVAIESSDSTPTYLENSGAHRLGEDLVHIYDTPSTNDKDPSLWVLVFFSLFFAMIVGDAGYGLMYLAAALFIRFKYTGITGAKKRVLNLVTILCAAVIGWGLLTSSFFGISLHPDNALKKVSIVQYLVEKKAAYHIAHHDASYDFWVKKYPQLKDVKDPAEFVRQASVKEAGGTNFDLINKFSDNIMLELALLIGVAHVLTSILRYLNRNWVSLGWIVFIIGGYLYLPKYLEATSMIHYILGFDKDMAAQIGLYMMIGGLSLAVILAVIKSKLVGILEAMTAVQIFSDILSYLRLYALGLASAIVSATINDAVAGLSLGLGIIIAIFGHGINMLLAIMSGTIHGLRLNFLEWYHYSFEGGGKMFKPLKKMKVE